MGGCRGRDQPRLAEKLVRLVEEHVAELGLAPVMIAGMVEAAHQLGHHHVQLLHLDF